MKKLAKYIKGYIKESISAPLFKLLEASFELIIPLIIASIVDNGILKNDTSFIVKMCLILLLLGAFGLGFSITAQYFAAKASVGFISKIRHELFSKIQTLSYSDIDSLGTSTMITRITSDSNRVQNGYNLTLRLLLRSPFVVFGAMIMAFTIDTKSALTFVAVIPILSVIIFGIMLTSMPMYKNVQKRTDKILSKTRENLSGNRVIRAFCKENDEISEFCDENDKLTSVQKNVGRISSLMNPLTYVVINFAVLWLVYTGALQVSKGNLSQGQVIALYNYMCQILVELIKLANLIVSITRALASSTRIANILDMNSSEVSGEIKVWKNFNTAVEFDNVTLTYKGSCAPALSNISFSAKKGETIGIIGGTGSGKTSLINMIPGFYRATYGQILIDGENIENFKTDFLREKIGVVPQKAVLFRGSVRDNMKWGNPKASDEEINKALELACVKDFIDGKDGLDTFIRQDGKNLSGGQKQRLTIARAIVRKPEILILDDSSSALDFATDAKLRRSLKKLNSDTTLFIVSQRTSAIMESDKIIVLDDGRIVGQGRHKELLDNCSVYREIYESQYRKEG